MRRRLRDNATVTYADFPTTGHTARWRADADEHEATSLVRWDNRRWTLEGTLSRERVQFAMRLDAVWRLSQFLLFRDLATPDLWLGTDGSGRWGEVNGAHRPDLDGCSDVHITGSPVTLSLPIRRVALGPGEATDVIVAAVDVTTLEIRKTRWRYARLGEHRWRCADSDGADVHEFEVDEFGLPLDIPGAWHRT